ncbi:MAG TPA: hypothetical protein VEX15_03675 [Nocardioidaceae bacterium]|nr:hypothetical protein [Nocardioidaceae bacterium]
MRLTIGVAAATLLLGAALVGCGGDEPAVCGAADDLKTSVDNFKDIDVTSSSGVTDLENGLSDVESDLADVKSDAESEFSSQIDAVDSALTTLKSSVDTATTNPTAPAVAEVGSAASAFTTALDTLVSDVQGTC